MFSPESCPSLRPISLNPHAGTSASEPSYRLWRKPVRVQVSRRLKQIEPLCRRPWRRLSRQPQMRENALNLRGLFDPSLARSRRTVALHAGAVYRSIVNLKRNRDRQLMAVQRPLIASSSYLVSRRSAGSRIVVYATERAALHRKFRRDTSAVSSPTSC